MKGFVFVDKPKGVSSFAVVKAVRKAADEKKVGHAGTLDPLATGLMLVAIGQGTKLLEYFVGCDKTYVVKARLGAVSDTFDAEGEVLESAGAMELERDVVEEALVKFRGEIDQVPPKFSALKVDGKRAYELARKGVEVEMKSRKVRVNRCEILSYQWPYLELEVDVSSGTYIRSLVHDLGQTLGCGAYVEELRRTRVGDFDLERAVEMDDLSNKIEHSLVSLEEMVAKFDAIEVDDAQFKDLKDGKAIEINKIVQGGPLVAFGGDKLVGVLENARDGGLKFRKMIL